MPLQSVGLASVDKLSENNCSSPKTSQSSHVYYIECNENDISSKKHNINSNVLRKSNSKFNTNSLVLTNDNFQMNVINRQTQDSQQQQRQRFINNSNVLTGNLQRSTMVNEDMIEQGKFTVNANPTAIGNTGGSVVSMSANDYINQTQIIKFVNEGDNGNLLIDTSPTASNVGSGAPNNSKVHVISNVTFVSKPISNNTMGQSQQTINVVNTKSVPYITPKQQTQHATGVQKIMNVPFKATNSTKTAQHLSHNITSTVNLNTPTNSGMTQKISMPRNVQVLTRVQNVPPSSPQLLHSQTSTTIQHNQPQQELQTTNNQIMIQQKIASSKNAVKKQVSNQTQKLLQHKTSNHIVCTRGTLNYFHQQTNATTQHLSPTTPSIQAKHPKSQKTVRQIGHGTGINSSGQSVPQIISAPHSLSNNKISNLCIQQGSYAAKHLNSASQINSTSKYTTQNQMLLSTAMTAGVNKVTSAQSNHNVNNMGSSCNYNTFSSTNNIVNKCATSGVNNNSNNSGNVMVVQSQTSSICSNINNHSSSSLGGASTVKYLGAHGSILQQPHADHPTHQHLQQTPAFNTKSRSINAQHVQTIQITNQQICNQSQKVQPHVHGRRKDSVTSTDTFNNNTSFIPLAISNKTTKSIMPSEEIMIVNGTQMTEEMSARILQSLSQKASLNNTRQYQSSHIQTHFQPQNSVLTTQQNLLTANPSNIHEKQNQEFQDFQQQNQLIYNHPNQNQNFSHVPTHSQRLVQQSKNLAQTSMNYESLRIGKCITGQFKVKGDNSPAAQQAEHEDDIIGEEIRPQTVLSSDARLQALNAVLQDHNYVREISTRLPIEIPGGSSINICGSNIPNDLYVPSCSVNQESGSTNLIQQQVINPPTITSIVSTSSMPSSIGFPFLTMTSNNNNDDDANSVISDESRTGPCNENDLGEETETAPEAEAEDDSVTRCICDLTHDDGYMICCDKCSAWQHVDCMGIDRQNIPDEYLCEICQPREVDRARAKNLQLTKRREQSSLQNSVVPINNSNPNVNTSVPVGEVHNFPSSSIRLERVSSATTNSSAIPTFNKKNKNVAGSKRKELLKRVKKDRSSTKRRDSKRVARRKSKASLTSADTQLSDKGISSVNQWLENYEVAVTNHYSPELRARLHAVCKQQSIMQNIIASENKMLKNANGMESKCAIVPFSGGKILISNFDIQPHSPIIELRGKYMLMTQYKTQNPSVNTNNHLSSANNSHSMRTQKIPGPFIFFYKLCNDSSAPEICVDTRTYANEARFVRRSCRPNAEIQHYFEKGTIHLYIVSTSLINGGTEITIKHEPHDLIAVSNKQSGFLISPTSTACACDAPKECIFSNQVSFNIKSNRKISVNGFLTEKNKGMSTKKETPTVLSRGRSISSSGESNAGLLSPNANNNNPNSNNSFQNPSGIANVQHDSGVYTSSSSPSVSLPSPTHTQIISSPKQQQGQQKINSNLKPQAESVSSTGSVLASIVDGHPSSSKNSQKCLSGNRKVSNKPTRTSTSEDPSMLSGQSNYNEEKHENRKLSREERKMDAIIRAFEKMEKTQQRKQELKQARSTNSICKIRNSNSPSPKVLKSQSVSELDSGSMLDTSQARKKEFPYSRKKKRKGSKSHLNNSQQKRRRRINSNDSDILSSEESCLLSPTLSSGMEQKSSELSNVDNSESYIQDVQDCSENTNYPSSDQNNINQAAGLLLALANNDSGNNELDSTNNDESIKEDNVFSNSEASNNNENSVNTQSPPIVSSTCLLVEAAVAPLETVESCSGEFKLPTRTKTKKSIMNDWLSQSIDFQQSDDDKGNAEQNGTSVLVQGYDPKGLDTLVQAAATICDYGRSTSSPSSFMSTSKDETPNFSIVAKKVEEFIQQTNINLQCSEELMKHSESLKISDQQTSLHLPVQYMNGAATCAASGNSSVKKRWLRQAISEECTDDMPTFLPASSPTQYGPNSGTDYNTPLKKRRVIRQCTEEELCVRTDDLVKMENDFSTQFHSEVKSEIKEELSEADEEVDVLTTPLTETKPEFEDNIAKFETKDENDKVDNFDVNIEDPMSSKPCVKTEEDIDLENKPLIDINIKTESSLDQIFEGETGEANTETCKNLDAENYACVSDEIADIQKRLHSFHRENIMILQSRNKKSKNFRNIKSEDSSVLVEANGSTKKERQQKHDKYTKHLEAKPTKKEQRYSSSKRKQLDFSTISKSDNSKLKDTVSYRKSTPKSQSQLTDSQITDVICSTSICTAEQLEDGKSDLNVDFMKIESNFPATNNITTEKQLQAALTIPTFNHIVTSPTTTILQNNLPIDSNLDTLNDCQLPSTSQIDHNNSLVNSVHTSLSGAVDEAEKVTNSQLTQPPPLHLPYYNTIYGKLMEKSSNSKITNCSTISTSNTLLSEYLDSKLKSYSTLGDYISHSSLFSLNSSTNVSSIVNSTQNTGSYSNKEERDSSSNNDSNNNTSRLATPCSTTNIASSTNSTLSNLLKPQESLQSVSSSCSKILTKTASADPRLNPTLTAPEPAPTPKRKLSINEYRKRKQKSTEVNPNGSIENSGNSTDMQDKLGKTLKLVTDYRNTNEKLENSSAEDDKYAIDVINDAKVQFSPTPTLLEQQQETLCERLKSLKNKSSSIPPCSSSPIKMADLETGMSPKSSTANILNSNVTSFCLNKSNNIMKDEFLLSQNVNMSSLESISSSSSSSSSPRSSKESSPERVTCHL